MTNEITPIFVMGTPRSGTTFLASSIAGHENVVVLPELHFLFDMMEEEIVFGPLSTERKVHQLKNDFHFCSLGLFETLDQLSRFVEGKDIKTLVLEIVRKYNQEHMRKDYTHWVEHSPHSHRYLHIIKYYFPNAVFVHSLRDPRAVYVSTVSRPWGFKDVVTGASNWKDIVTDILAKERYFNILSVKYEDVIDTLEPTLRRISEHLGLSFDSNMLSNGGLVIHEYLEASRPFANIGADYSRKEKWRQSIKTKELEHINSVCWKLMEKLGYSSVSDKRMEITGFERRFKRLLGVLKQKYTNRKFRKEVRGEFCRLN